MIIPVDPELEVISDHIRRGELVSMAQAVEAIDYQCKLREERKAERYQHWYRRMRRWLFRTRP